MKRKTSWHELDRFTQGYVTSSLWSSTDNYSDSGGEPLDNTTSYRLAYEWDDIASESQARIISDCLEFQAAHSEALAITPELSEWTASEQNGHDYWLTRNRHGAGFWDRNWSNTPYLDTTVGEYLTDASHKAGAVDIVCYGSHKLQFRYPLRYVADGAAYRLRELQWQKQGLQQTRTGYGSRLTTRYECRLEGEKRWRRIYAICYSNAASYYVLVGGKRVFVRASNLELNNCLEIAE